MPSDTIPVNVTLVTADVRVYIICSKPDCLVTGLETMNKLIDARKKSNLELKKITKEAKACDNCLRFSTNSHRCSNCFSSQYCSNKCMVDDLDSM